jgi:hypothetical protein
MEPDSFELVLGRFGFGVTPSWGQDGRLLFTPGQRKYVGRATAQRDDGTFGEMLGRPGVYGRLGEYELFRTWHWYHRFQRATRTVAAFRRRMWDMARMRMRDIQAAPWDPPAPAPSTVPDIPGVGGAPARRATIGDVFTSELSFGLVYRWHIYQPSNVLSQGCAAQRLRQILATAQTPAAPTQPAWGISPNNWNDDHEEALIWALRQPPHPAPLNETFTYVAEWPNPANPQAAALRAQRGFALDINLLPAGERQMRIDRSSFQFDGRGLPPTPP